MAVLMFTGNRVFMHYLGDAGVGAFGVACYYMPFIFMIGNAIAVYDKFCKIDWSDNEQALRDFQLIDYTLLCGAIGYDAAAGLSNKNH